MPRGLLATHTDSYRTTALPCQRVGVDTMDETDITDDLYVIVIHCPLKKARQDFFRRAF